MVIRLQVRELNMRNQTKGFGRKWVLYLLKNSKTLSGNYGKYLPCFLVFAAILAGWLWRFERGFDQTLNTVVIVSALFGADVVYQHRHFYFLFEEQKKHIEELEQKLKDMEQNKKETTEI